METLDGCAEPAGICWEQNDWTPFRDRKDRKPKSDADYCLDLAEVDPQAARSAERQRRMAFHAVGCTGDPTPGSERPQDEVAAAMAAQLAAPGAPAFLYHLGDIAYKCDDDEGAPPPAPSASPQTTIAALDAELAAVDRTDEAGVRRAAEAYFDALYAGEFYSAYSAYQREIFAIPGNHDGKHKPKNLSLEYFRKTFCDTERRHSGLPGDNSGRRTMPQPNLYWRLDTPVAHILGLYANVVNGGQLDDPELQDPLDPDRAPQFGWLLRQLKWLKSHRDDRAVLLAVHYPPYSGAANFVYRGDPRLGKRSEGPDDFSYPTARPLALTLNTAFERARFWPDAVLTAHAHLYQRLTFIHPDNAREIPYLVCGSGGHAPGEGMWDACPGRTPAPAAEPALVQPQGFDTLTLPNANDKHGDGRRAQVLVEQYNDTAYGFLRIDVDLSLRRLSGEFIPVLRTERAPTAGEPLRAAYDSFTLDLDRHRLIAGRLAER